MRSGFWSRLALALLAVTGVFVPVAETVAVDEVTVDGAPRPFRGQRSPVVPAAATVRVSPESCLAPAQLVAWVPEPEPERAPRFFLLHRAWLI